MNDKTHPSAQPRSRARPAASEFVPGVREATPGSAFGGCDVTGTTMQDFESLLSAVGTRLRSTVGHATPAAGLRQVLSDALECAQALDQLQALLSEERHRQNLVQQSARSLQKRLTQALSDLDQTRAEHARAHYVALHDELTSLPNRSCFRQRLDRALRGASPAGPALAVLYLDLDGMKAVNDTHGHGVGDQLLVVVAARLRRSLRSTDVAGRLGGDEFALLLADVPGAEFVASWAARLDAAISAPVQLGDLRLQVRASIGIAMNPEHGRSAAALVHNADQAMYKAKRDHSGPAFFDSAVAA
jgi:diguanylate cyclase (GGDEF)-like protein